ncbi:MAG: FeoC-like transcriptional regulator [Gammaproteobacteria bacterium]
MSLIAIKQYMMQVKVATLGSLCGAFASDPETMRCLLRHWMQKGKIRPCLKKPNCGSKCFKCPMASNEMYEWVDEMAVPLAQDLVGC